MIRPARRSGTDRGLREGRHAMDDALLTLLRASTHPRCNAVEVGQGRRGFAAFTRKTMISSAPADPPIVGFARTAKISGAAPPVENPEVVRAAWPITE